VTGIAGCREPHCRMNGIGSGNIVSLMAGVAVRACIGITPGDMAVSTFGRGVTPGQCKETVIKSCSCPLKGVNRVTCGTIFLKPCLCMVWLRGGRVVLPVAVDAINPGDIKPHRIFRYMAVSTVSSTMCSQQGETTLLMDPRNVCHEPAGSRMTPFTVQPDRRLMNIGMAVIAFRTCFPEHQGRMTESAVCFCMLPRERQFCSTMIKRIYSFVKVPSLGAVADATAEPEILSVRVTCLLFQEQKEAAY